MKTKSLFLLVAACCSFSSLLPSASAQGTAFTYQGRLDAAGSPANGIYDLEFTLFDAASGGTQQSGTWTQLTQGVTNGLFTVELDFGSFFPGASRWLEIGVRTNGNGAFTTLAPRQALTPTPYAIQAGHATLAASAMSVAATNIVGPLPLVQLPADVVLNTGTASGFSSTALGQGTTAGGVVSIAAGSAAAATGLASTAFGVGTTASGNASTAMGRYTVASNDDATAMGLGSTASGWDSVAMGTYTIAAGHYSTAAGFYAEASNHSCFVWADSTTTARFSSSANNQFLIRATGGVGINTNNPNGAALAVNGNLTVSGTVSVPAGQFVKSVNGQTDAVTLTAGNGLALTNNQFSLKPGTLLSGNSSSQYGFRSKGPSSGYAGPVGLWGEAGTDFGASPGVPCGVFGASGNGAGVFGMSQSANVFCAGVAGLGIGQATGVLGNSDSGYAVKARTGGTGSAIYGENTSLTGFAGDFNGNVRISGNVVGGYLNVTGAGNEQAYIGGDGAGGDVEIGSRNAGIMNVGFWNSAAGSRMNVYCLAVNPTSDRNAKENFTPLDARAVLAKVVALPLTEWNYKADTTTKHIGPMAQDFYAAFGVGPDDKHIATVDADGVALAAIQGLNEKVEAKNAEIAELKRELDNLKQVVNKLVQANN